MQKGLQLIVRASVQQGSTKLKRLGIELYSDSFHAVLDLSRGPAKQQYCITTVTIDNQRNFNEEAIIIFFIRDIFHLDAKAVKRV